MCGVGAVFSRNGKPVNPQELNWMVHLMQHRGPDGQGVQVLNKGQLGLVHTRLAINDHLHGHQPMSDELDQVSISYNGEIYDCARIRAELSQSGYQFKTNTDTEVVIKLYLAYGLDMFKHMNGEFAFVLWDNRKKRLLAGRDRFGIKPLYCLQTPETLAFASEMKPLLVLDRIPFKASHDYLLSSFMGNFIGHESFFEGISAIKPGHYMLLDQKGLRSQAYWEIDLSNKSNISFGDAKAELAHLLKQAVNRRLVADTEVVCYLSGGIDSTIVAALAAQQQPQLKSFSIGFNGASFDESSLALQSAQSMGLSSSILMADKSALADAVVNSLRHIEIPISSPQPIGMSLLSRHIRDAGIKTCLTGDGSDELFAGYAYFKLDQLRAMELSAGKATQELKQLYQAFYQKEQNNKVQLWFPSQDWHKHVFQNSDNGQAYVSSHVIRYHSVAGLRHRVFSPAVRSRQESMHQQTHAFYHKSSLLAGNSIDFNRALSKQQLSNYIFPMQSDRVQMSHSVEARVPFLDNDVVAFAQSLPSDYLMDIHKLQEKYLLNETFKDTLPEHMRFRHKQAYHTGYSWDDFSRDKQGKQVWQHYMDYSQLKNSGLYNPLFVKFLQQVNRFAPRGSTLKCKTDLLMGNIFSSQVLLDQLKPEKLKREAQAMC